MMLQDSAFDTASLSLRGVGKSYRVAEQPLTILSNVNLDVAPGEFVCIVGASGCGKSTLLRLIVGLDADYGGTILQDERRIEGPSRERGIVFQDHRLFPWLTIAENVALGLDATPLRRDEVAREVRHYLDLVGLGSFAKAYPHQLSGGMAQRAAIARALVSRPQILLLDEPFGALDSLTRAHMQRELLKIWERQRVTVVMVTHDVEEAVFLADRVVVMHAGPGRVTDTFENRQPRPRHRADAGFIEMKEAVLERISH